VCTTVYCTVPIREYWYSSLYRYPVNFMTLALDNNLQQCKLKQPAEWSSRVHLSRQSDCPSAGPSIHIRNQHLTASPLSTGRPALSNPYPTTSSVAGGGHMDIQTYHTWGLTSQNDGARRLPIGEPDIREHGRWRCNQGHLVPLDHGWILNVSQANHLYSKFFNC
jgi:hypothetical protein